jgi:sugar phosphate isomerase/epimerase
MSHAMPKLHNAMWPGLVGKEEGTDHPPISLERMLELTAGASVGGQKFDGIDYFLFHPHTDPDASEDELRRIADLIAGYGFKVGSLVAPVWPGTVGDSAMGTPVQRGKFIAAVRKACRIARIFNEHGVREYGVIRIDSAAGPQAWYDDPAGNTKKIAATFREAATVAAGHGERLAAEGETCWAGMHSWRDMLNLLEAVDMPGSLGFQADLAHTYLYLLGYNAPEHALLKKGYSDEEFWAAYKTMTDALRPWTIDFHVAQNNGEVFGSGTHDKTGRHCLPNAADGKLDIVKYAGYWLRDENGEPSRRFNHICWDGCMFPNETLMNRRTWNDILAAMVAVRNAHGWRE